MNKRYFLLVVFNWPPHGGPGVYRWQRLSRGLIAQGWEPIVVSSFIEDAEKIDHSLLTEELRAVSVLRTEGAWLLRQLRHSKKLLARKFWAFLNVIFQIPDPQIFWARRAFFAHCNNPLIKKCEIVVSSSGPYSSHFLGYKLAQYLGLKWIADFRDPWSDNLLIPYLPGYRVLNRVMEKHLLKKADAVTSVSQQWLFELAKHTSKKCINKEMPNGFDAGLLNNKLEEQENSNEAVNQKVFIGYFGSFYRNRSPESLLAALEFLSKREPHIAEKLSLEFYGRSTSHASLLKYKNCEWISVLGYVESEKLSEVYRKMNWLLLILAPGKENSGNISGKVYEYLASGLPILVIADANNEGRILVEKMKAGLGVSHEFNEVFQALRSIVLDSELAKKYQNNRKSLFEKYSHLQQGKEWANFFETVLEL